MPFAKTKIEKYEIAGRLELGREGDCITYKALASQYEKSVRFIATNPAHNPRGNKGQLQ
jgi:hypothetical protein